MRITFKVVWVGALGCALLQLPLRAADEKAAFKDDREKASYGMGMYFGNMIKRGNMDPDLDQVMLGLKDVLAGNPAKLTEQEQQKAIQAYQQESRKKIAEKNKQDGEVFLADNKKKPGVQTKSITLPDGTTAELQYKVIAEGTGAIPKSNDLVSVNYRGTLINGKEFDSSAKHPTQPAKFMVNRVVRGWTDALEMMKVGSKWQLFIPSTLAYGDNGNPSIEPGSTLIFDIELLGIEAPPAPAAPAQPLTSDIIKVPSAEELKKGAKIEVIKPEDAARMAQEAARTNAPKQ